MSAKSIAGYLGLALVIWWVIQNPHGASDLVTHTGRFLSSAASGISNFFASI